MFGRTDITRRGKPTPTRCDSTQQVYLLRL
jgi:hypothetical protein